MSHTFTHLLTHIVFSTKERVPCITIEMQSELYPYLGGLTRELNGKAYIINGIEDHIHLLVSLPPTVSISEALKFIKANSSGWLGKRFGKRNFVGWQVGYGAFSVSKSNVSDVISYIRNQKEHHKKFDFKAEFISLLKKHEIEYDERYIWD